MKLLCNFAILDIKELEEPGQEHTRFDMICPTVVRPKRLPGVVQNHQVNLLCIII